jgi:hypothetical protein
LYNEIGRYCNYKVDDAVDVDDDKNNRGCRSYDETRFALLVCHKLKEKGTLDFKYYEKTDRQFSASQPHVLKL